MYTNIHMGHQLNKKITNNSIKAQVKEMNRHFSKGKIQLSSGTSYVLNIIGRQRHSYQMLMKSGLEVHAYNSQHLGD